MSLHLKEAPPPGAKLRALVDGAKPVALRRPWLELAVFLACGAALATGGIVAAHVRRDAGVLPRAPMMLSSVMWALAVIVAAVTALVPPARQVLPSQATSRAGAIGALLLALATLAMLEDSPRTFHPDAAQTLTMIVHCERFGVLFMAPLLFFGWALVLRKIPVGGWVGAALGAASGAFAGFVLHLVCAVGGAAHVLFGHVALVAVGALAGLLFSRR